MQRFIILLLAVVMLSGQTKLHGPSQTRQFAPGASAAWYYGALSFGTVSAGQCADLSISAPGVSPGMPIAPGWPSDLPQQVHGIMYCGQNIVVVRLCAAQTSTIPPGLTYSAAVLAWR